MDWKQKALSMKIDGKSWTQIYAEFPDISTSTIRHWVRRQPEYKSTKQEQSSELRQSTELKKDGTIVSEKLITVRDGYDLTPEYILKAHGLDPVMWQMVSYKNNMWNSQRTGGVLQVSFQSKVTAKPIISFNPLTQVEEYFKNKQFSAIPSIKQTQYDPKAKYWKFVYRPSFRLACMENGNRRRLRCPYRRRAVPVVSWRYSDTVQE